MTLITGVSKTFLQTLVGQTQTAAFLFHFMTRTWDKSLHILAIPTTCHEKVVFSVENFSPLLLQKSLPV